ncbi:MAG: response regulator [Rhodospirillaceae bacterium]|jgi:CheY-like chemotaxis protein|nr:response regulator [Rhodospirillaceae bacterium]
MEKKHISALSVLVVEDDLVVRDAQSAMLRSIGVGHIVSAKNGNEAINKIEDADTAFDAILLDIFMPESDGVEFFRRMADKSLQIPIIVVSGAPDSIVKTAATLGELYEQPIKAIVRKPISSRVLKALLEDID